MLEVFPGIYNLSFLDSNIWRIFLSEFNVQSSLSLFKKAIKKQQPEYRDFVKYITAFVSFLPIQCFYGFYYTR